MATLIPALSTCLSRMTAGEKRLIQPLADLQALRRKSPATPGAS